MAENYEDIINLPHHVSKTRKPMSRENRAAQFAPFAALTGYDASVAEEARLTDKKIELSEEQIDNLNHKIGYLLEIVNSQPQVSITYFVPDAKKDGGKYETAIGNVRRIDEYQGQIIFTDKSKYNISDILLLESDIFPYEMKEDNI